MQNRDYKYIDTWIRRENKLQGIKYEDYLRSAWWQSIRDKAKARPKTYSRCQFCKTDKNIHLHHTSYKWIFTARELSVIIPLCASHHYEVHEYAKKNQVSVRIATNILRDKYVNSLRPPKGRTASEIYEQMFGKVSTEVSDAPF
jgi:hypothetical protein